MTLSDPRIWNWVSPRAGPDPRDAEMIGESKDIEIKACQEKLCTNGMFDVHRPFFL